MLIHFFVLYNSTERSGVFSLGKDNYTDYPKSLWGAKKEFTGVFVSSHSLSPAFPLQGTNRDTEKRAGKMLNYAI